MIEQHPVPRRVNASVAVLPNAPSTREQAALLAESLSLPLISTENKSYFDLLLEVRAKGLALAPTDRKLGNGIRIDFAPTPGAYKKLTLGSTRQPLAKAVGIRIGNRSVIDATAGLGRDAFHLACLGCRVLAMERSPILAAMLNDALDRASRPRDQKLIAIVERISVMVGDSRSMLTALALIDRPDVVYLDPMFTSRESSALARKEMRILRMLVGGDEDAGELLRIARETATKRVVVKRHLRAPPASEECFNKLSRPSGAVRCVSMRSVQLVGR